MRWRARRHKILLGLVSFISEEFWEEEFFKAEFGSWRHMWKWLWTLSGPPLCHTGPLE